MKRIAVWNTAFLGDAVLTLPLIQTLADAFPGSEIDFYVRRGLASLFEAHPALHAVYEYDKRRIAGNNAQHDEDEQYHADQHRNGAQNALYHAFHSESVPFCSSEPLFPNWLSMPCALG